MPVKLVVCAPYFDTATFLWSPFLKGWVANELRRRCVEPLVLWGSDCVPNKFAAAMADPDVKGVLGVGHGSENEFTGQGYSTLVKVGVLIPKEWKDDCFAPVSCLVGRRLLPYLIDQGVPCGLGEVTEYWFTAMGTVRDGLDPEEDPLLKYFLYAEYTFWYRLAEGATAGEAYDAMIEEYKQQAEEAKKVDSTTWWCLQVDWQNRKFFGDRGYRLPPAPERVLTKTTVTVTAERQPTRKRDVIQVAGRVEAEDGTIPMGWVRVKLDGREDQVPLDSDGTFATSFTVYWEHNIDTTYTVKVEYEGWRKEKCYVPSAAATSVTVKSTRSHTSTKITKIEAKREDDTVHLTIEGEVKDADDKPVVGGEVEILVWDDFPAREYVKTDEKGRFSVKMAALAGWLETLFSVHACYKGDDLRMPSCDKKYVKFPPNWKVILTVLGAAAIIIALIFIAITVTGG